MKKLLLLTLMISFFAVAPVSAQINPFEDACEGLPSGADAPAACSTDGSDDPIAGEDGVIIKTVTIMSYIVGFASVLMVMVGGLKFITANGDPNSVSSARNTVLYALIGVVVFLSSQLIVRFVVSRL